MGKRRAAGKFLIIGGAAGFLGLFAGLYFVMARPGQPSVAVTAAQAHLARIAMALEDFAADCGRYPTAAEGFSPLLARPPEAKAWRGPYLAEWWTQEDPWGNAIRYIAPGAGDSRRFGLVSAGPDGRFDTGDDISNRDAAL